jgi:outer membrane protein OmpA-like peptidoglycan-associated protein
VSDTNRSTDWNCLDHRLGAAVSRLARRAAQLGALVAVAALSACSFSASVKAGGEANAAEEPPPPETPAATEPTPEPEAQPAKAKVKVNGAKLELETSIAFEPGSAAFLPGSGSEAALAEMKTYLEQNPRVTRLRIEGHTNNTRAPDASLQLSGQRAQAVKQWLRSNGIHEGRLLAVGFGDTQPVASNADAAGQAENERIAFRIAELDGKPYLGPDPLAGGTEFP